jgi:hypothetical protein
MTGCEVENLFPGGGPVVTHRVRGPVEAADRRLDDIATVAHQEKQGGAGEQFRKQIQIVDPRGLGRDPGAGRCRFSQERHYPRAKTAQQPGAFGRRNFPRRRPTSRNCVGIADQVVRAM